MIFNVLSGHENHVISSDDSLYQKQLKSRFRGNLDEEHLRPLKDQKHSTIY